MEKGELIGDSDIKHKLKEIITNNGVLIEYNNVDKLCFFHAICYFDKNNNNL